MNWKVLLIISSILILTSCASTKEIEYIYKTEKIDYQEIKISKVHLPDFKYIVVTSDNIEDIKHNMENGKEFYIIFTYEEYKKAALRETTLKSSIAELVEINKYYKSVLDASK